MPGACPRGPNRGGAGMRFTKRRRVFSTIAHGGFNRPGIRPKIARLEADSVKGSRCREADLTDASGRRNRRSDAAYGP